MTEKVQPKRGGEMFLEKDGNKIDHSTPEHGQCVLKLMETVLAEEG